MTGITVYCLNGEKCECIGNYADLSEALRSLSGLFVKNEACLVGIVHSEGGENQVVDFDKMLNVPDEYRNTDLSIDKESGDSVVLKLVSLMGYALIGICPCELGDGLICLVFSRGKDFRTILLDTFSGRLIASPSCIELGLCDTSCPFR